MNSYTDDLNFTYKEIFTINENNNPGNPETEKNSAFYQHKNQVIQKHIMENLAQAIYMYEGESGQLPNLTGEEWEQVLGNVSIVSFLQGIPIGLKTYNSYAIATSTNNKEYVDPNEIYFINNNDEYYHRCYCNKTYETATDYIGYRSVDFVERNYITDESGNEETKYYYLHNSGTNASMSCYYCLVNRANYMPYLTVNTPEKTADDPGGPKTQAYKTAYDTALARERYKAKQDVILAKEYAEFTIVKEADIEEKFGKTRDDKAEIGDTITWTITISNDGRGTGTAYFYDEIPEGLYVRSASENGHDDNIEIDNNIVKGNIYNIAADGDKAVITIVTDVTDAIIEFGTIMNTAIVKNNETDEMAADTASCPAQIEKTVEMTRSSTSAGANIVFILDQSSSIYGDLTAIKNAARDFINEFDPNNVEVKVVAFAQNAKILDDVDDYASVINLTLSGLGISTNYIGAFHAAEEAFKEIKEERETSGKPVEGIPNYIVFMTDGGPTASQWPTFTQDWTSIEGLDFVINIFSGTLTSLAGAVVGGWYECLWIGENQYAGNLLLTSIFGFPTSALAELLNLNDIYAKWVWSHSNYNLLGDSRLGTISGIMQKVDELVNTKGYHLFTIMYGNDPGGRRAFGLSKIAEVSEEKFEDEYIQEYDYTSADKDEFKEVLKKIADAINGPEVPAESVTSSGGSIELKDVDYIKSILIQKDDGTVVRTLTDAEITKVKNSIVKDVEGNGYLNLNIDLNDDTNITDTPFRTIDKIVISY